jgi:hypothetical protein
VRPKTNVAITNAFGKRVASLSLGEKNVLPSAERKFNGLLEKKYLFGKYTATATAVYGAKNTILTDTYSFVVIPYKVVIPVLVGLLLLLIALAKGRKRLTKAIAILLKVSLHEATFAWYLLTLVSIKHYVTLNLLTFQFLFK